MMDKVIAICGVTHINGTDEFLVNEAVSREIKRQRELAAAQHNEEMKVIAGVMDELLCQRNMAVCARNQAVASRNKLLAQRIHKRRTSTRMGRFLDKVELCWAYAYSLILVVLWRI